MTLRRPRAEGEVGDDPAVLERVVEHDGIAEVGRVAQVAEVALAHERVEREGGHQEHPSACAEDADRRVDRLDEVLGPDVAVGVGREAGTPADAIEPGEVGVGAGASADDTGPTSATSPVSGRDRTGRPDHHWTRSRPFALRPLSENALAGLRQRADVAVERTAAAHALLTRRTPRRRVLIGGAALEETAPCGLVLLRAPWREPREPLRAQRRHRRHRDRPGGRCRCGLFRRRPPPLRGQRIADPKQDGRQKTEKHSTGEFRGT